MSDEIFDRIRELLQASLGVPPESVRPETRLSEDLQLDSLDLLQLTFDVEERFGLEIPEGAIRKGQTLGELAEILTRLDPPNAAADRPLRPL